MNRDWFPPSIAFVASGESAMLEFKKSTAEKERGMQILAQTVTKRN
jgi:hypothetical protein